MTIAELRAKLAGYPGDWTVTFGLQEFNDVADRGSGLIDIELHPKPIWDSDRQRWYVVADDQPPTGRDDG